MWMKTVLILINQLALKPADLIYTLFKSGYTILKKSYVHSECTYKVKYGNLRSISVWFHKGLSAVLVNERFIIDN